MGKKVTDIAKLKSVSFKDLIRKLPLDKITLAKENVRKFEPEKGLAKLQASIQKYGLIQPVIVLAKGSSYKLIVGQRRYLAYEGLKRKTIPALVIDPLNTTLQRIVSFGENILRRSLPYEDTIKVCDILFKEYKGKPSEKIKKIADDLSISTTTVKEYLAAKLIPSEVKKLVTSGKLSRELAYRITAAHYPNVQKIITIVNYLIRLTNEEKERAAEYGSKKPSASVSEIIEYAKNPPPLIELIIHVEYKTNDRLKKLSHKKHTNIVNIVKEAIDRYLEEEE